MIESFKNQIKEKLLGPGYAKDVICCNDEASDEILSKDPKFVYCTGVLMHQERATRDPELNTQEDDTLQNGIDNIEEIDIQEQDEFIDEQEDNDDDDNSIGRDEDNDDNVRQWTSSNHIGLIACVDNNVQNVEVRVTYATYSRIPNENLSEVKIKTHFEYNRLRNLISELSQRGEVGDFLTQLGIEDSFEDCFEFSDENRTVSIRPNRVNLITTQIGGQADENNEVVRGRTIYDIVVEIIRDNEIRNNSDLYNENIGGILNLLLMSSRVNFFQREAHEIHPIKIPTNSGTIDIAEGLRLLYENANAIDGQKRYIKIIIENTTNDRNFYQTRLKLTPIDNRLQVYTDPIEAEYDPEFTCNEYIYRDVKNYGKGIGCAVEWDNNGEWIQTTYIPECKVSSFSNKIEETNENIDIINNINEVCTLRNISKWGLPNEEILRRLESFVDGYSIWCEGQRALADGDNRATEILANQNNLCRRLRDNIIYMRQNLKVLECFKLANTAMLVQMVISRDTNFEKNRETVEGNMFNRLDYFQNGEYIGTMPNGCEPAYRPFQLAFLLMNVKSTFENNDPDRTQNVDLIWFPTGGGKTEAYLALTALTIIKRRRANIDDSGVSVIMRYTLRLLTSQQFERASLLICALEFLRRQEGADFQLGNRAITIGLWIGKASTPNKLNELNNGKYHEYREGNRQSNPFPVSYCPWCGKKINREDYRLDGNIKCSNINCTFNYPSRVLPQTRNVRAIWRNLPIDYIDETIYRVKPTLLFATVDKFAQLCKNTNPPNAAQLMDNSPDLIIQDELHLISGPLGSTVGLFETIVEEMANHNGSIPKIVASTATTRNTEELVNSLYGRGRNVNIFPPQGISYKNNYFSHIEDEDRARRTHIGIIPTGKMTSNDVELRLTAYLLLARIKVMAERLIADGIDIDNLEYLRDRLCDEVDENDGNIIVRKLREEFDNLWSIVLYYNSLRDLGRSSSRTSQEIKEIHRVEKLFFAIPSSLFSLSDSFTYRKQEFTSREESSRIKDMLTRAESKTKISIGENQQFQVDAVDLVYASNMISVGIDIARWNIMLMVGQPRSVSEYIQSSSRIARSVNGLVFNLINPLRTREYSLFENYVSFHAAYYKYVEPLSATPLNATMLDLKLWNNIARCYRNLHPGMTPEGCINGIIRILKQRFDVDQILEGKIRRTLQNVNDDYMLSLRNIDKNSFVRIERN